LFVEKLSPVNAALSNRSQPSYSAFYDSLNSKNNEEQREEEDNKIAETENMLRVPDFPGDVCELRIDLDEVVFHVLQLSNYMLRTI
jgi:predicted ester cyclase